MISLFIAGNLITVAQNNVSAIARNLEKQDVKFHGNKIRRQMDIIFKYQHQNNLRNLL